MHVLHQGTLYATRRLLPRGIMGDGGVSQRYVTLSQCVSTEAGRRTEERVENKGEEGNRWEKSQQGLQGRFGNAEIARI